MSATAALVGGEPWAKELERLLSQEDLDVLLFARLDQVPPPVDDRRLVVVIAARYLGLTECLAIQELRELMPSVTLILSTVARASFVAATATGSDIAVEEGATVLVAWPPDTELLHRMLREWCRHGKRDESPRSSR